MGIDYADELLKIARGKSTLPNLQFVQQDVAHIKLDQTFDAAICMWSTFGELPYKEMLRGLRLVLKPDGLFVIDTTHYLAVPTASARKTYTSTADGVMVYTEIDETYNGKTRIREIVNTIDGKTFRDHSEMDVLTEADFVDLLGGYGLKHTATYYDYLPTKKDKAGRIQLLFAKSN